MAAELKYYKNSNTGDLIVSKKYIGGVVIHPVYWYRNDKSIGEDLDITGYVQISEKKYIRESKKLLKSVQK